MRQSNTFKRHRQKKRMSQFALAIRLGVSVSTIQKWEAGVSFPIPRLWPLIQQSLGISEKTLRKGRKAHKNTLVA